jgi:hypothetical protein
MPYILQTTKIILLTYATYKVSTVQKKSVGFYSWSQNHILKHFMGNKSCDLPYMCSEQDYWTDLQLTVKLRE